MARFYMNDFVTYNTGELVCGFDALDEARVHIDRSSRDCKGVHLGILYDEEAVIKGLRPHDGNYPLAYLVYITLNLKMVYELELFLGLSAKFPTDPYVFILLFLLNEGHFGRKIGAASSQERKREKKSKEPSKHDEQYRWRPMSDQ